MKGVYAIFDVKAQAVVGGLHLFAHDAAAVRMFGDVATMKDGMISAHPEDYQLVCLGTVDDEKPEMVGGAPELIVTGAAWLASRQPSAAQLELAG